MGGPHKRRGWLGQRDSDLIRHRIAGPDRPLDWRYDLWTDTRLIRFELGCVKPVSLDEALHRTVDWGRA